MSKFRVAVWRAFEYMFAKIGGVHPIDPTVEGMFLIAKRTYLGHSFEVQGVPVQRGSKVIELHVNNELVMKLLREERSLVAASVKLLVHTKHSLPAVAAYLSSEEFDGRDVLYGISFIHRGIARLGFETHPMSDTLFRRLTTWHLKRLYRIVNPEATAAMASRQNDFVPKIVAMSKHELFRRYLHVDAEETRVVSKTEVRDVQPDV